MKTMNNRITTAVSIMVLAMSVAVIGPAQAMAKEKKLRSTSKNRQSSASSKVRRSSPRGISDGTSNTIMVGERSGKGIISPRDSASGLPTGIVSGNHAKPTSPVLRARKNHRRR
jgi:hypothetical protein